MSSLLLPLSLPDGKGRREGHVGGPDHSMAIGVRVIVVIFLTNCTSAHSAPYIPFQLSFSLRITNAIAFIRSSALHLPLRYVLLWDHIEGRMGGSAFRALKALKCFNM